MHQYLSKHQTLRLAALTFLATVGIVDGILSERSGCALYQTNHHERGTHNHYKSWSRKKQGGRGRERTSSLLPHNKLQLLKFLWEVQTGAVSLQSMPAERCERCTPLNSTEEALPRNKEEKGPFTPLLYLVCAYV